MQETRNKRLLILFGFLLTTIIVIVVFLSFGKNEDVIVDKNLFKVADFSTIDKVVLAKKDLVVELMFDGTRWKVGDQLADRNMIDVLFATLQQAEPRRPVAAALRDSINKELVENGVTVRLYQGETVQKEFQAGGNPNKTQAYFKDSNDENSYVMVIPGYRVYTSGIFELNKNGWKDRYAFTFNWKNFKSLKATFPGNLKNNFEVAMGKDYFEIKNMITVDTTKLNDFLDAISLTQVEQYVNPGEIKDYDSLLKTNPLVEIFVGDISGRTYSLTLYEIADQARVLGIIGGTDPAYLDRRKVKGLLKSRTWFAKN